MKRALVLTAAMAALLFAASAAEAQARSPVGGFRGPPPSHHGGMHGRHGSAFFIPFLVERQAPVVIEREVVREVPVVVEPPPPPSPPRKPYVLGRSYASLPGGCMKMIEGAASYYLCSGEWYRQVGSGRSATYKAVAQP